MAAGRAKSTLFVAAGQVGQEGLGLVRNVILARALGPAEMGVVAALTLVLSLLDMISDLGPDRLLIQAADGHRRGFQGTAHAVLVLRGILCAGLLLAVAYPVGYWIGRTDAAWMIAVLALVPLIRGLMHLDCKRVQRDHQFRPQFLVEFSAAVVSTVAACFFVRYRTDASALVWVSLVQVSVLVSLSHLLAERPYRLCLQNRTLGRLWQFGWPLALNSLIMFAALQGDRMVAVSTVPAADLGRFTIAFQITLVPALLISRIASTLWLPALSRFQNQPARFQAKFDQIATILGAAGLLFVLGIQWLGNLALRTLYGPAFEVTATLMCWLAITQGLRILRALPSLAAMSRADSRNPLISNFLRLIGVFAASGAAIAGYGLEAIALCGCMGEFAAFIGSMGLLRSRHQIDSRVLLRVTACVACGATAGALATRTVPGLNGMWCLTVGTSLACLLILVRQAVPAIRRDREPVAAELNPVCQTASL